MTDLLYDCHAAVKTGTDPETAFAPVAARFRQIVQELDLAIDLESELRQIEAALASGASEAYCVSRGEYLSGRMLAALLAAGNLSFWLCDRALAALTRYYHVILKPKLKKKF